MVEIKNALCNIGWLYMDLSIAAISQIFNYHIWDLYAQYSYMNIY